MPNIFEKRTTLKPYEYPELIDFVDAINHSYWLHSEFNYNSDIQDFKANLSVVERSAVTNAMLAISQIEVNVKRFWSNLYNQFPKPEFDMLGVSFGECHIEGTEILTPNGWVNFEKINVGDLVAQYTEDCKINFTPALRTIKEHYSGEIHKLHKKGIDVQITPNHRIVYFDSKGNYTSKSIKELGVKNSNNFLPEAGIINGEIHKLTSLERLKIAIQADGSIRWRRLKSGEKRHRGTSSNCHTYEISVKKERKKERLFEILKDCDVTYRTFNVTKTGYIKVEIDMDTEFNYKQFNWVVIDKQSHLWCKDFVEELSYWDGTRLPHKKDCKIKYSTTDKTNADIVQMIGTLAGYKANMGIHKDSRKETFNDVYIVSFIANREKVAFSALKETIENYTGNIYCVTVPSGAIVTRYNNCTFIGGNSEIRHLRAYANLLELLGLNEAFEKLIEEPVIQGRIDYLEKYLKNASSNNKEQYILTLTLFSLFIENVSLFSQFLIIKSFNKEKNLFKGIDNVIQATRSEEDLHAKAGAYIISLVKKQCPEIFTQEFYDTITRACKKAFSAEEKIVDWIFQNGEIDFLPKNVVIEFLKDRFNKSLEMIGANKIYYVNTELLKQVAWFDVETLSNTHTDFFNKVPTNYTKKAQSITSDDLF
jgi:ribonucleotide reductase beta subunit family protein with ferritin-like domain